MSDHPSSGCPREVKKKWKILKPSPQRVVAVASKGSNYEALTGNILVFRIDGCYE